MIPAPEIDADVLEKATAIVAMNDPVCSMEAWCKPDEHCGCRDTARSILALQSTKDAETISAQAAEIKALREALEWQPIETAPKDGTPVLLLCDWEPIILVGIWDREKHFWKYQFDDGAVEDAFSPIIHWRPLPAAPAQP